jgi:hypothetical protein
VQAAVGVAILPEFLVQQEIAAGQLIQPFAYPVRSTHAYHLVYPEEKRELPTPEAFRDYLFIKWRPRTIEIAHLLLRTPERWRDQSRPTRRYRGRCGSPFP